MPITLPVSKTIISTAQWGIPITNLINDLESRIVALEGKTATTAWTNATLLNGWTSFAGYSPTAYRKIGDMVQLRGYVIPGTIGANIFQLPAGFWPPLNLEIACSGYSTARIVNALTVFSNGFVRGDSVAGNIGFNFQFSTI